MQLAFLLCSFWALLVVSHAVHTTEDNAGIRIDINPKGLDYIPTVVVPMLIQRVLSTQLSPYGGESHGFDYAITNIHFSSVWFGDASLVTTNEGIQFSIDTIHISISADWKYREHSLHVPKGSGTLVGTAGGTTGVSTLVDVTVDEGSVQCIARGTHTRIDKFDITVSDSLFDWLYNIILDGFNNKIKDTIVNQINSALDDFISSDLNRILRKANPVIALPFHAPFDNLYANITPVAANTTLNSVNVDGAGLVFVEGFEGYPAPAPFVPVPEWNATADHMLVVTLSTYVINSGLWSVHNASLLTHEVTPDDIPDSSPIKPLNTSFIKPFAPGVYKAFPNSAMHVVISAVTAPVVAANSANETDLGAPLLPGQEIPQFVVTAQADFLFKAVAENGTLVDVFLLTCPANVSALVFLDGSSLHANFTVMQCELQTKETWYGPVAAALVAPLVDSVMEMVVMPRINQVISNGFPIPAISGVSLYNGVAFATGEGAIRVLFDFKYLYTSEDKQVALPQGFSHRSLSALTNALQPEI